MTASRPTTKRPPRRGHAAAGARVLVGGLATSATLGIAGILAAPANRASIAAANLPRVRARITLARPRHVAPPKIAARAPNPARVARAAPPSPVTAPAPVAQSVVAAAPVVTSPPAPVVTAAPVTAPPAPVVTPQPPVAVSTAS